MPATTRPFFHRCGSVNLISPIDGLHELRGSTRRPQPNPPVRLQFDVVVVGAGPAGLGVGIALQAAGVEDFVIIDARGIGASFEKWPRQMRMITPSFYSNPFHQPDLNAIDPLTSPGDYLKSEHPTGQQYAAYLRAVSAHYKLPTWTGPRVKKLTAGRQRFTLKTTKGEITATHVVWAAGQFCYPNADEFPGSTLCRHNSTISDWSLLEGDEFAIIGGYESGMDAAANLRELGKTVHVLSRGEPWADDSPDPSRSLSLRTRERMRAALAAEDVGPGRLHLYKNANIINVERVHDRWVLKDQDGVPFSIRTQPILANGFFTSLGLIQHLVAWDGPYPVFSEACDESTTAPNLFYSGPDLRHRSSMFCFIYKFRSRFGLIAREIATRLGCSGVEEKLSRWSKAGFMNTDLDCCTSCQCAITPAPEQPAPVADYRHRADAAAARL